MAYYNKYYTYPDMFLWQDETYAGCMNGAGPLFLKLGELIRQEESVTPPADRFPGREDLASDAVNRMAYYPDYVEGWKKRGMHFSCSGMMGLVMAPTAVKEHKLAMLTIVPFSCAAPAIKTSGAGGKPGATARTAPSPPSARIWTGTWSGTPSAAWTCM